MKQNGKRLLASLTAAGLLLGALLSCSDGGGKENGEDKNPADGDAVCVDYTASNLGASEAGEGEKMTPEFVTAVADFGFSLLSEVTDKNNSMISPVSILSALGMTANGAVGETRTQMQNTLFGGTEMEAVNRYFRYFADGLPTGEGTKLNLANSIWLNQRHVDFSVNEAFLATNAAYYDAGFFGLDFMQADALSQINGWVAERTDNMIPQLLNNLTGEELMLLINTVLFDGKWEETYQDYAVREGTFTTYSGKTAQREMLSSTEDAYFYLGEGMGFLRPYAEKYSFVGILPNAGVDVYEYAASITGEAFHNAVTKPKHGDVQVRIPSFTFEFDAQLQTVLSEMGMPLAFSPRLADFSGMGECEENIYIAKVIHKTKIELTREGTKAAGATAVVVETTSAAPITEPIRIYLDRPFVFAIVENESGLPVFCGIVGELE